VKKIRCELPIYTYQIDFLGHVSNIVYIQWMEIGRLKLMETVGMPVHQIAKQGFAPVLMHTEIAYHHMLVMGDTVVMELWLSELKKISARLEFRFYNQTGTAVASGSQKGVIIDLKEMRPRRLHPEEQQLFEPYLASEPALP
jgi:acyl-CoA thioester hydrolase